MGAGLLIYRNINDEDFNYSHTGDARAKQYVYLLNQTDVFKTHHVEYVTSIISRYPCNFQFSHGVQ